MAQLYGDLFKIENIEQAIKFILKLKNNEETNNQYLVDKKFIQNIKQFLRCCKFISKNANYSMTIQIAHQAVTQIIMPFIQNKWYDYSKIPVCKACSKVTNSSEIFAIQVTINNSNLINCIDLALNNLRSLGVTDARILKTIKYLVYNFPLQDTILGNILINCYLLTFDNFINQIMDKPSKNFSTDFARHKNDYIAWLKSRNRKISGLYYRFNNECLILMNTRSEQLELLYLLNNNSLGLTLNLKTNYNQFDFLGYHVIKRYENKNNKPIARIGITPSNPKQVYQIIKSTKWNTYNEICESLNIVIKLFNTYDICNNMKFFLNSLGLRLLKIAKRKKSILKKVLGKVEYLYSFKQQIFKINIYELRKIMKVSFKEYLMHPDYLIQKDQINTLVIYLHGHQLYRWGLWIKQHGLDGITGKKLNPKLLHIHHINGNHNDNSFNNLLLISKSSHHLIHSNIQTDSQIVLYYRHKCCK